MFYENIYTSDYPESESKLGSNLVVLKLNIIVVLRHIVRGSKFENPQNQQWQELCHSGSLQ